MEKKLFIEDLYNKRSDFNDPDQAETMSNLLDTVSSDIYSESQRFVFELIQNADDAAEDIDNEVHFEFFKDFLIVSHNGQPFNEDDIKSLTSAGSSTKKADTTKTGYKGIGFKSVFGKSNYVAIFSDGFQFRFDKSNFDKILPWQIIPIWTEQNDLPSEQVQNSIAKNKYNVSTIIKIEDAQSLENDLKELLSNGQILLFLRRVSKISISKEGNSITLIEKKKSNSNENFSEVAIHKNSKEVSSWITKTYETISVPQITRDALKRDEKTPKKLKDAEFTEISFAAKLENRKIRSLNEVDSLIFTYLPTKVRDFKLPFLINGSFLTNAAREGIHEDKVWNQWLFELIAEKTFEWLQLLSTTQYKYQVLHLLPRKFNNQQNELKQAFDISFNIHCSNKSFIVTDKENIKNSKEVILDKTGLSTQTFIDHESITDYLKTEKGLTFSDDCFVSSKVEESSKLKSIGVEVFELENFDRFFKSTSFTSRHSVSHNYDLICYFKEKSDDDKKGIWFQTLKTLPFIYDENNLLYNPSNGICFPTGISSTELGDIPIIHPNVFEKIQQNNLIFEWLKKIGVREPSLLAYVTNVIIPNLEKKDFITNDNFLQVTHYLFRLNKQNELDEEVLESLRELKIKTKSPDVTFREAQHCFLSDKYQPQLKIEGIIKDDIFYVSEEYLFSDSSELEWNLFFKAIGVQDRVEIKTINNNNSLSALKNITHEDWVNECRRDAERQGGFGFGSHNAISLVKLPSFINLISTSFEYSKLFWNNIIINHNLSELIENARYKYGQGYGHNSYAHSVKNYFPWFIKNQKCIPTSTKEILEPEKVFINEIEVKLIASNYIPVFDYDNPLSDTWKELLNLKDKLELSDYLLILTKLCEQAEDEESKIKPSIQRIGLIYNKIANLLLDMPSESKKTISDWALTNKLLSENNSFEPATELKWITIEGFSLDSDKLKLIQIPENVKKNSDKFSEFVTLLQIQTIDEFIATFDAPIVDNSLKKKFEEILPYYVALVEKRNFEEKNVLFENLYAILESTVFYTATEIKLSFNYLSETFDGPTLTVYKEKGNFYFKGRWKSERTLLSLIKELTNLLGISGLNEELRFLLLESDENEIKEWLIEQGIDLSKVLQPRKFSKHKEKDSNKEEPVVYETQPEESVMADPEIEYDSFNETNIVERFSPTSSPKTQDISNISAKTKIFTGSNIKAEANFSKIESQDVREDVGRWCEEFVYEYLIKSDNNFSSIVWVNMQEESGKPYDIEYFYKGRIRYIDVKGTPSGSKDLIYLSPNEWVFMFDKAENYSIYRVYNAGNDARIEIIENPSSLLQQGKIFPNPITLQV